MFLRHLRHTVTQVAQTVQLWRVHPLEVLSLLFCAMRFCLLDCLCKICCYFLKFVDGFDAEFAGFAD